MPCADIFRVARHNLPGNMPPTSTSQNRNADPSSCGTDDRYCLPLNSGWLFRRGRVGRAWLDGDGDGQSVHLPHGWNAIEEFQPGREYYRGPAAYRLFFTLPERSTPGHWRLRSHGFYGTGVLRVNGQPAGAFSGDYLGWKMDVGNRLRAGDNLLSCTLTNACPRYVLPGIRDPDFLLYGGLAGGAWLEWLPALHWNEDSLLISSRDGPEGTVDVTIEATAMNVGDRETPAEVQLEIVPPKIPAHTGLVQQQTALEVTVPSGGQTPCRLSLTLPRAARWSSRTPWLYTARLSLRSAAGTKDVLTRRFGIRRLEWRPNQGLFRDGEPVPLRGCNRHEQMPGFGNALPTGLHRLDAQALRTAGFNFVRLSHYPQSPHFLEACDREGIWVMPELASWKSVRGGRWLQQASSQLARLVRRDRHHPSVLLWCLGNESRHRRAYLKLDAIVKALDPEKRPTLYAENHIRRARRKRTLGITDIWGVNYEFEALAAGRAASRLQCALVTECSNMPMAARGNLEAEAAQRVQLASDIPRAENEAEGFAVWSFNDYATLRKKRYLRQCGVFDGWRMPKEAAQWLAASAENRPVLWLQADWSLQGEDTRTLRIVTNCRQLARVQVAVWPPPHDRAGRQGNLTREELHAVQSDAYTHECRVRFDGHPLRIQGSWQGRQAMACIYPWGPATDIRLDLDSLVSAGPCDETLVVMGLQVVDAQGHAVLDYTEQAEVRLSQQARAALLGGRFLPVAAGAARIFTALPSTQDGPLHLQVSLPGLRSRGLSIDIPS